MVDQMTAFLERTSSLSDPLESCARRRGMSSSKRSLSPAALAESQPPARKQSQLSSWLNIPPAPVFIPSPLVHSAPTTVSQSSFIAHATVVTTAIQATEFQTYIRNLINSQTHPSKADHEMLAWRLMVEKMGKSKSVPEVEDWVVKSGGDDDGENRSKLTMVAVLEDEGCVDVAVVVSRYYGGIMLGPRRFQIITDVTRQAVRLLAIAIARQQLLARLAYLDDAIAAASVELLLPPSQRGSKYDTISDEKTLERLIKAREKRLELLTTLRERKEQERVAEEAQAEC